LVYPEPVFYVSAEEHMANYRAARALMGKGRNAGEGVAGLFKEQRQEGRQKVRGGEGETKEVTLATAFSEKRCS
jgi:hypothetical protein